jgi:chemotaxis protein MotA
VDIASIVGFILAYIIIGTAISLGGPFILFVNAPSMLIVIGGTFAVTLMRVTLGNFLGSFKIGLKGFFYKLDQPQKLIEESVELANVARKEGILALEGREISNSFLERGIGLCIDGHAPEVVKNLLAKDINQSIERHTIGADMF